MTVKRPHSPELIPNPFIKAENRQWSIAITGLPRDACSSSSSEDGYNEVAEQSQQPYREQTTTSAIEAGRASIENRLEHFSAVLAKASLSPPLQGAPHLSMGDYHKLFERNAGSPEGAHFIIHQHDHPIAGTHYDLRLQINATSSASWAIMYGVPGDPNSFRLNRNATETRIHCLWNHLVETASHAIGSLLIWDTGIYTILSAHHLRREKKTPSSSRRRDNDYSQSSAGEDENDASQPLLTEQQKLHQAFTARKIRVRLHGSRLPSPYVLNLRLTRDEDATGRARSTRAVANPSKRRRRRGGDVSSTRVTRSSSSSGKKALADAYITSSDSDDEDDDTVARQMRDEGEKDDSRTKEEDEENISTTERELRELEDAEVRRTNAYPGATNSIGSVHQRRWYLSLDREASGFVKRRRIEDGRTVWERVDEVVVGGDEREGEEAVGRNENKEIERRKKNTEADRVGDGEGDENKRLGYPFYVRGVEHERSIVTGRLGADVLRDEGVVGYVGRKGWLPILK